MQILSMKYEERMKTAQKQFLELQKVKSGRQKDLQRMHDTMEEHAKNIERCKKGLEAMIEGEWDAGCKGKCEAMERRRG